jgi:hypothetical protein
MYREAMTDFVRAGRPDKKSALVCVSLRLMRNQERSTDLDIIDNLDGAFGAAGQFKGPVPLIRRADDSGERHTP